MKIYIYPIIFLFLEFCTFSVCKSDDLISNRAQTKIEERRRIETAKLGEQNYSSRQRFYGRYSKEVSKMTSGWNTLNYLGTNIEPKAQMQTCSIRYEEVDETVNHCLGGILRYQNKIVNMQKTCQCLNTDTVTQKIVNDSTVDNHSADYRYYQKTGVSLLNKYNSLIEGVAVLRNLGPNAENMNNVKSCFLDGFKEAISIAMQSCSDQELAKENFRKLFSSGISEFSDNAKGFQTLDELMNNLKENTRIYSGEILNRRGVQACVPFGQYFTYETLSAKAMDFPASESEYQLNVDMIKMTEGRLSDDEMEKKIQIMRNPLTRIFFKNDELRTQLSKLENRDKTILEMFEDEQFKKLVMNEFSNDLGRQCESIRSPDKFKKILCEPSFHVPSEFIKEKDGVKLSVYRPGSLDYSVQDQLAFTNTVITLVKSCREEAKPILIQEKSIFDDILLSQRSFSVKESFEHNRLKNVEAQLYGVDDQTANKSSGDIFDSYDIFNLKNCPLMPETSKGTAYYLDDLIHKEFPADLQVKAEEIIQKIGYDRINTDEGINQFKLEIGQAIEKYFNSNPVYEKQFAQYEISNLMNLVNIIIEENQTPINKELALFKKSNRSYIRNQFQINSFEVSDYEVPVMDYFYNATSEDEESLMVMDTLSQFYNNGEEVVSYSKKGIPQGSVGDSIYQSRRNALEMEPTLVKIEVEEPNFEFDIGDIDIQLNPQIAELEDNVIINNEQVQGDQTEAKIQRADKTRDSQKNILDEEINIKKLGFYADNAAPLPLNNFKLSLTSNDSHPAINRERMLSNLDDLSLNGINRGVTSGNSSQQSMLDKLLAMRDALKESNGTLRNQLTSFKSNRERARALRNAGVSGELINNNGFVRDSYAAPNNRNPYNQFSSRQVSGNTSRSPASTINDSAFSADLANESEIERLTDKSSYFGDSPKGVGSIQNGSNGRSTGSSRSKGAKGKKSFERGYSSSNGGSFGQGYVGTKGGKINFEKIENLEKATAEINQILSELIPELFEKDRPYVLKKVIPHSLVLNSENGYRQLIDELGLEGRRFTTLDVYFVEGTPSFIVRVYDYNVGNDVINDKEFRVKLIRTLDLVKSDSLESQKYMDSIQKEQMTQRDDILANISAKLELMYVRPACSNPDIQIRSNCVGDEEIKDLKERLLGQEDMIKMIEHEIDKQLIH